MSHRTCFPLLEYPLIATWHEEYVLTHSNPLSADHQTRISIRATQVQISLCHALQMDVPIDQIHVGQPVVIGHLIAKSIVHVYHVRPQCHRVWNLHETFALLGESVRLVITKEIECSSIDAFLVPRAHVVLAAKVIVIRIVISPIGR